MIFAQTEFGLRLAGLQIAAPGRVELGLEQIQHQPGDVRMVAQHLGLHGGGGIEAGLLAIAGQRPDQRRLAPMHAQLDHQPVERIAFGLAGPNRHEGGLEGRPHPIELQRLAGAVHQHELMHPGDDVLAACRLMRQGKAFLGKPLEAHVVQDRQNVGEGDGGPGAIELQSEGGRRIVDLAIGPHGDGRLGGHRLDGDDVVDRLHRRIEVAVARREGVGVAGFQRGRVGRGGWRIVQRMAEPVGPGAGRLGDGGLEFADIRVGVGARRDADHIVHARQRRVREGGIVGRHAAPVSLRQHVAGQRPQVRGITLARKEQQHRDEPVERVAPGEKAQPRPVIQVQNPQRDIQQGVDVALEQLVAGVVLQDVAQLPVAVAAGGLVRARQHLLHLAPDQRHLQRRGVVGFGGEQADEADLAAGPAVVAVMAHADIVHVGAPVHLGAQVGLGHHDRLGPVQRGAHGRGQHRRLMVPAQHAPGRVAQDALAALRLDQAFLGRVAAIRRARVVVGAGPQQDEVIVPQPAQKGLVFVQGVRVDVAGRLAQGVGRPVHGRQHGAVVADRGMHVRQRGAHPGDHLVHRLGRQRIDEDLDHRFQPGLAALDPGAGGRAGRLDHGVIHGPDRQARLGDLAHHRVHQEGRVGLQDLQPVVG